MGALEERVARAEAVGQRVFPQSATCQKLAQVEGIGPVGATALGAAGGKAPGVAQGRHLAAWWGVVARHHATGGQERRLGSSNRGDRSLRTRLLQGARAPVHWARRKTAARRRWLRRGEQRRGKNIAAVALVTKQARSAWALLTRDAEDRQAA